MSAARKPAFWRIVRDGIDDVREYLSLSSDWSHDILSAIQWQDPAIAKIRARDRGGRVVPVYVTVRKVKRGHDFAWALRQMRAGKSVRRRWWAGAWTWRYLEEPSVNISAARYACFGCDWKRRALASEEAARDLVAWREQAIALARALGVEQARTKRWDP